MRGSHTLLLEGVGAVDGYRLSLQERTTPQGRPLSKQTIANYLQGVDQFLKWCKDHELDYRKATRQEIRYYLGFLARDHAASTVYLAISVLRGFYKYLEEEHEVENNPVKQSDWRAPARKDTEPFTKDEMVRMYAACRNFRERAVYLLIAGAGLRRGEVFGIKRDDVNFDTGIVTVTGKGQKMRQIMPGAETIDALKSALYFEESLCPFNSVEWVWWLIKDLAKRAGIRGKVYTHRFRHNFATAWLDAGGTVEELATILGHSNISQSLYYAKAGNKRRALARMGTINMTNFLLGDGHQEVAG